MIPLVLAIGIISGIFIGKKSADSRLSPEELKIRTVLNLIKDQYVDQVNTDSLLDMTIPDMLASLDPHSVYIPASELQMANDDLESSFSGIGVTFQIINDTVNVIDVVPGGPAEKTGIQPGDLIIEANGKQLSGAKATSETVFTTLRGKEGTKV